MSPQRYSTDLTDSQWHLIKDWLPPPAATGRPRLESHKAIYFAVGVNMQGLKEVLGMWASENEGAKFWLSIITELKARGVRDIFIACVDGLKGFPEAIEAIYPQTQVQFCLVHLMRFSLGYVSFKDRKGVAADLKAVYRAATTTKAEHLLEAFGEKWDARYPSIAKS